MYQIYGLFGPRLNALLKAQHYPVKVEMDQQTKSLVMWTKMFKKERDRDTIRAGSVYRRVHRDNTVETAKVIAVRDDSLGIPHVRYQFSIGRSDRHVMEQGPRVLSLSCFAEHFNDPVTP
jgi:hypothetical protein